ncbi:MAG TPA: SgcJ/EcaC family oxidoreductase [Vicinamibacterales bacterium]|nr:SgcJ/EcaC family oxidoreductase [Vicinamibacterales bacterium]
MRYLILILALAIVGPAAPLSAQDRAADEAAIRAHAAAVERAINGRDAAALVALFTPDGDEINGDGPRLVGRDAIRQAQEARHAERPPTMQFTLEVTGIRFLGPDTAIVETVARFSEGPIRSNRGTWVSVRQSGTWLIAALRVYPAEQSQ